MQNGHALVAQTRFLADECDGVCAQARAHVLLKGKEAELRAARESGTASDAHQAELAAAKAALVDAQAAADEVRLVGRSALLPAVIVTGIALTTVVLLTVRQCDGLLTRGISVSNRGRIARSLHSTMWHDTISTRPILRRLDTR